MYKFSYLKSLTLLVICFAFSGSLSAQANYTLVPGNTVSATCAANGFMEPLVEAINTNSSDLILDYEVLTNTLNPAWSILYCYRGGCFTSVTPSAVMDSILPGDQKMIFKATLDPQGVPGSGQLVFRLKERTNPGVEDTITMNFDVTVVGIAEELAAQIKVFPQPVNDMLYVDMPASLGKVELDIVDLSGAVVSRNRVNGTDAKLDVSALAQGMYILRIKNDDIILNKRISIN